MNRDLEEARRLFLEGCCLMAESAPQEAEVCFREALRLDPEFAEAHANLGLLLDEEGKTAEAERQYRRALSLAPDLGRTRLNLGVLLANQKRFLEAEAAYMSALELTPDSPAAWSNLGVLQACRKEEEEAERSYRRALELDPGYRLASFNLSYLLLRQGQFAEGWSRLEARNWYHALERVLPAPRWRGEPLQGRSLLIGFEAGYGDMIQFCRYANVAKERGAAKITVICHPALKRLFGTLAGVDELFAFDEPIPDGGWDFWTPPLSMPLYCGTRLDSIPGKIPYLAAEESLVERWSRRLFRESLPRELRVGLVWRGNPCFENDDQRSLPSLTTLEPLGSIQGIRLFSLQKGAGEEGLLESPPLLPLVDLGPEITDFADTAAIVVNLDLIITVDTAVAHLAGALAKECWLLLPEFKPDWRWLTGRSDSPWYPGVIRIFRQPEMGEWKTVVGEVREALVSRAESRETKRTQGL